MKLRHLIVTVAAAFLVLPSAFAQDADKNSTPDTYQMLNLFGDVFERGARRLCRGADR